MQVYKIPKRYVNAVMDKSIKLDSNSSWYLSGIAGSGKTYYSWALYLKRLQHIENLSDTEKIGRPYIKLRNYALLTGRLRTCEFLERQEIENYLLDTKLLIIDDIGSELRTDYSDDLLFRILNHRYEEMLWTGFTSNMKIGELPYEDRIKSRIIGIVQNNKFHLESKDRRINKL